MPRAKTKSKRKSWTPARKAKFKRLWESGASVADIASEMRISQSYARTMRHRFGLTPRFPATRSGIPRSQSDLYTPRLQERAALTLPPLSPEVQAMLDRRERRERNNTRNVSSRTWRNVSSRTTIIRAAILEALAGEALSADALAVAVEARSGEKVPKNSLHAYLATMERRGLISRFGKIKKGKTGKGKRFYLWRIAPPSPAISDDGGPHEPAA